MTDDPGRGPAAWTRHPLDRHERRRVVLAGLAPVAAAVVLLLPFAFFGRASVAEVLGAGVVYGGLLGLAAGFVTVDRLQARQCPRCGDRSPRRTTSCGGCGYDLDSQPRYACDRRHRLYVEPGLCDCGRRVQRLEIARGIGREVAFVLKVGAWLLAFLIGVGVLLSWVG